MASPFLFFLRRSGPITAFAKAAIDPGWRMLGDKPAKSGFAVRCRYSPVLERMTHDCLDIGVLTQSIKRILDAQPRLFVAAKGYMR